MTYEQRTYRRSMEPFGLTCFEVRVKESDLYVCAERELTGVAEDLLCTVRWDLESYIATHPRFAESYAPVQVETDAPAIIQQMARAAWRANVGPMASVAGAVAEYVAKGLAEHSANVIVENGGDVYLLGDRERVVALWADQPGVDLIGLKIPAGMQPVAVCTSSAKVGPSVSFGSADAVTAIAHDGALADAVVTALANTVHDAEDIPRAVEAAKRVPGVFGVLITIEGHVGAWGNIHLVPLERPVQ
jgi:ApbE superfamily uncharacterized protein (UPF0280 family)